MDKEYVEQILKQTKENYNQIAQDFSSKREFMWKDLEFLIQYIIPGDRILDLGCGNGRLLQLLKGINVDYIGVDEAEKMIGIAKAKYPPRPRPPEHKNKKEVFLPSVRFQVAGALNLPFPNNYFDKIYSIAVLHHIPSQEFRLQFFQEAKRVLKPGGLLILTVWKLGQKKRLKLALKYTILKILGLSKLDFGDVLVPFSLAGGISYKRYIHNFSEKSLGKLITEAGFKKEKIGTLWRPEKKDYNIYAIAKKPS